MTNINIYTVNNKICHQSNIIISLIRNGYITLPKYSKFLEWNYIFCIIDPIITTNTTNSNNISSSRNVNYNLIESDTIEDIQYYNNKRIYKLYEKQLLSREIDDLETNIISVEESTNPLISESELSSPIPHFDNVLYNTLLPNTDVLPNKVLPNTDVLPNKVLPNTDVLPNKVLQINYKLTNSALLQSIIT